MNREYLRPFETRFASETLKVLAQKFREKSKKANKNNKFKPVSKVYSINHYGNTTERTNGCNQEIERIRE